MDSHQSTHVCLGIPVPRCLQTLTCAPPVCSSSLGDKVALELLRDFGKKFSRPTHEIVQACNLASGPSDLVIILQRPSKSQNYSLSFEQFVRSCKTLQAVDALIRLATNDSRSIDTVTVLDAFSYKPTENCDIPDERCHELLAQILRVKKPKVILRCHTDSYCISWMKRIELPAITYKFEREEVEVDDNHIAVVLQSFHPSRAVNYADDKPEYLALLMYHFIAAFSELGSRLRLPKGAEDIRELCVKPGGKSGPEFQTWEAADRISEALELRYGGPQGAYLVGFADEREPETLREEAKIFGRMYSGLERLSGMSHTFGALGIARALFLWKRHFKLDPLYEQVASLLLVRGSQEEGWFPAARHDQIDSNELSVEDSLSQLQVTKTGNAACLRSAGKSVNLQHIQDLNSQSTKLASAALLTFTREREPSKDDRTQALSSGICYELAELVKRQNDLIKECLRYSSTTDLNNALQISGLVIQCEFLASIIKSEEYVTIELRDIMKEDFTRFIVYSEQLKDAFVAPDMTPGKFSRWASERD